MQFQIRHFHLNHQVFGEIEFSASFVELSWFGWSRTSTVIQISNYFPYYAFINLVVDKANGLISYPTSRCLPAFSVMK